MFLAKSVQSGQFKCFCRFAWIKLKKKKISTKRTSHDEQNDDVEKKN